MSLWGRKLQRFPGSASKGTWMSIEASLPKYRDLVKQDKERLLVYVPFPFSLCSASHPLKSLKILQLCPGVSRVKFIVKLC